MLNQREQKVIDFINKNQECSSKEIHDSIDSSISYATVKRLLTKLIDKNYIATNGQGKSTRYRISSSFELLLPIDIENYFEKEIDERTIRKNFNFDLIKKTLFDSVIFTKSEIANLNTHQKQFENNIKELSNTAYNKELERLAIDLSWKSSQIEGNTYSLLETEKLLMEKQTASGKTKDEAIMLLNHKDAIDFIVKNPDYVSSLTNSKVENIHRILIKDLGVEKNIRKRRVGISGTNYRPLDNEFQIKEAMIDMCHLVNKKNNVFEKALLALALISYIQPFTDGNKRTARIISNAILIDNNYCPISFRTVDSIEYKKAMLLFYEQNNLRKFKEIFIHQFEFAVKTYF